MGEQSVNVWEANLIACVGFRIGDAGKQQDRVWGLDGRYRAECARTQDPSRLGQGERNLERGVQGGGGEQIAQKEGRT